MEIASTTGLHDQILLIYVLTQDSHRRDDQPNS